MSFTVFVLFVVVINLFYDLILLHVQNFVCIDGCFKMLYHYTCVEFSWSHPNLLAPIAKEKQQRPGVVGYSVEIGIHPLILHNIYCILNLGTAGTIFTLTETTHADTQGNAEAWLVWSPLCDWLQVSLYIVQKLWNCITELTICLNNCCLWH